MGFKQDFIWGAATAAYQIEGAAYEDGKGLSVWDDFCRQPGRISEGHTGDVACDHYHRFKEDVALMAELGMKAYRFSIGWPRIYPDGIGKVNEKGLDFYKKLADELLSHGITPYATLFHWDYPLALLHKGGWLNGDSSDWFSEYTHAIGKGLGGVVKNYFTLNEPQCFIGLSYLQTAHAPGIPHSLKDNLQMAHNVLLSHGKAVQVLRSDVKDAKIGYAPTGSTFYPISEDEKDIEAARHATFDIPNEQSWGFNIAWWSDPALLGQYPERGMRLFESILPKIGENDMKQIHQPLDFYGQNICQSTPVQYDEKQGYREAKRPIGHAKTAIGWPVTPESLYWAPKFLYERYKTPIVITENGLSCHDVPSPDGKVHDPNRIDFLRGYLQNLKKAASDGVDVQGYFQWSLMDNFEWAKGYDDRFGLIYVDYESQKRIPKDSAFWYQHVMETNGAEL